jgi:hypothetical protein
LLLADPRPFWAKESQKPMKHFQLDLKSVIATATGLAGVYVCSILFSCPLPWILTLLVAADLALVWMVIRILKDPFTTNNTFDQYYYQDREDLRRNGDERCSFSNINAAAVPEEFAPPSPAIAATLHTARPAWPNVHPRPALPPWRQIDRGS